MICLCGKIVCSFVSRHSCLPIGRHQAYDTRGDVASGHSTFWRHRYVIPRKSMEDVPSTGHSVSWKFPRERTEICTLLPEEPPKDSNVCCVTVVCRWPESLNVVGIALPFHRICDSAIKPLPSTVNRKDSVLPGMELGNSDVICGCAMPWQLTKKALHVQPEDNRTRATRSARQRTGDGLDGRAREECIRTSHLRAPNILHPNRLSVAEFRKCSGNTLRKVCNQCVTENHPAAPLTLADEFPLQSRSRSLRDANGDYTKKPSGP